MKKSMSMVMNTKVRNPDLNLVAAMSMMNGLKKMGLIVPKRLMVSVMPIFFKPFSKIVEL